MSSFYYLLDNQKCKSLFDYVINKIYYVNYIDKPINTFTKASFSIIINMTLNSFFLAKLWPI